MDIGRLFERIWSRKTGAKQMPNSGAGKFLKMDAENADSIVWSCKATKRDSQSLTKKDLREVYDAVKGAGGAGGSFIPAMAITFVQNDEPKNDDPTYVVLSADDFLGLFQQDVKLFAPDKSAEKIALGNVPALLRQAD